MNRYLYILFFLVFLTITLFVKQHFTKGFNTKKIVYTEPYNKKNEFKNPLPKGFIDNLNKSFTYLGHGRQAYVFESFDKKYVIKFIRYHKSKKPLYFINKKYLQARKNRLNVAILSYKIAYQDLQDITGVEYLHLNQTNFLKTNILVKDALGKSHIIELDRVGFLIQKKTDSFEKIFLSLDQEKKKNVIDSVIDVLIYQTKKNIVNLDFPRLIRNSGYLDNHFVAIDVGSFAYVEDKVYLRNQFSNFAGIFQQYLRKNSPENLQFFEKRLEKEKKCLNL